MFDPEPSDGAVGSREAADAAAVERIIVTLLVAIRPGRRVESGTSIERRVGSDGARPGGSERVLLPETVKPSSGAVEQAAAGDQGKGRQQNF